MYCLAASWTWGGKDVGTNLLQHCLCSSCWNIGQVVKDSDLTFFSLLGQELITMIMQRNWLSYKVPCWFPGGNPCLTTSVCTGPIVNIFPSTIKGIFMIVLIDYCILTTSRLSKSYQTHRWGFCNFAIFFKWFAVLLSEIFMVFLQKYLDVL